MKRTLLILSSIALLSALLIGRLIFKQRSELKEERLWFAKAVRYEFSARVDTVVKFNQHTGRLRCVLTQGDPQIHREDSLKKSFKAHDMLYLIFKQSGDTITLISHQSNLIMKGDSLRVSSRNNLFQFFRDGKPVFTDSLNEALLGFTRPFFLKEKKK